MPSRRPHRKSKAGCLTCKKRHVKCDEQRPQCIKCSSRSLNCVYENISTLESLPSQSPYADSRTYSATDLELLHHYCVNANASLALSIGLRPEEAFFILPKIAFGSDFVLRAVLALAALHRAYLQDQQQSLAIDYTAIAAGHINDALPAYREALLGVTEENCTALLMFSSLLTVYVLAMSRNGMNPFQQCLGPTEHDANFPSMGLVPWLRLITGGMSAIKPWFAHILSDAEVGPCLNSDLWTVKKVPQTNDQALRDSVLEGLERLWTINATNTLDESDAGDAGPYMPATSRLSFEARSALSETLASLRKSYLWVTFRTDVEFGSTSDFPLPSDHGSPASSSLARSLLPLFVTSAPDSAASTPSSASIVSSQARPIELSAILWFLHALPDEFLMLLHQRHPFALILMAHYAVLLQQKDVWWMRGLGQDMFTWSIDELREQPTGLGPADIEHIQPETNNTCMAKTGWLRWTEWPRKVFGPDPGSLDSSLRSPAT